MSALKMRYKQNGASKRLTHSETGVGGANAKQIIIRCLTSIFKCAPPSISTRAANSNWKNCARAINIRFEIASHSCHNCLEKRQIIWRMTKMNTSYASINENRNREEIGVFWLHLQFHHLLCPMCYIRAPSSASYLLFCACPCWSYTM